MSLILVPFLPIECVFFGAQFVVCGFLCVLVVPRGHDGMNTISEYTEYSSKLANAV